LFVKLGSAAPKTCHSWALTILTSRRRPTHPSPLFRNRDINWGPLRPGFFLIVSRAIKARRSTWCSQPHLNSAIQLPLHPWTPDSTLQLPPPLHKDAPGSLRRHNDGGQMVRVSISAAWV